ncbi:TetR/AcrR family transcriptional regulator [Blastococcus sp. SYSU DS0973]
MEIVTTPAPLPDAAAADRVPVRSGRREKLIATAASLFEAEGYHQTSMERLADRAGLAKPSLYHYFKSKEEILFEIHLSFIQPLIQRQSRRMELGLRPSQILLEAVVDHLEVVAEKPGTLRMFFEHHRELGPDRRAQMRENRVRYRRLIEETITAGVAAGELRPVDARLTAFALFGMVNWAYKWFQVKGQLSPRETAYFLWDLFMRGVQADRANGVGDPVPTPLMSEPLPEISEQWP